MRCCAGRELLDMPSVVIVRVKVHPVRIAVTA